MELIVLSYFWISIAVWIYTLIFFPPAKTYISNYRWGGRGPQKFSKLMFSLGWPLFAFVLINFEIEKRLKKRQSNEKNN